MSKMYISNYVRLPWGWIILGIWIALLSRGEVNRLADEFSKGDWARVVLVLKPQESGPPDIRYKVVADRPLDGDWTATVRLKNYGRISTRKGDGDYKPTKLPPVNWPWSAFFEDRWGSAPPVEPRTPYRVCVEYRMMSVATKVSKDIDLTCTRLYDPMTDTFIETFEDVIYPAKKHEAQ